MPKTGGARKTSGQKAPMVKTYTVSELESKQVDPQLSAKVVHAARMTVTRYSFRSGGRFPHHVHNQEQVTYVLDGQLTFLVDGQTHRLCAGDLIVIPVGIAHSAEAGSAGAEVLSVVSPARQGAHPITLLEPVRGQKR